MKDLKFSILFIVLLMLMGEALGQGTYNEILSTPESTEATKSITRAWKDNAQITYIEDIEYAPFYPDVINSITAKFVYYDPTEENEYLVAEFDNSLWPRITDMEVLEDTLYFCGYANVAASSTSPQYLGYIGYFCIPQLFDGTDNIHVLTFNQQPGTPDAPSYWFVNEPCKIEVFKVSNGIHAICTGGWSTSRGSLFSGGQFVADIVHEFSTGDWWYYIHRGDGTEIFSDVAVTDNYVMTAAPKSTLKHLYMRVFTKPQSVSYNPSDPNRDPSIFDITHRTPPFQSYYFTWNDNLNSSPYINYLKIEHPLIIHTNGDTVALSYLTYSWLDRHIYGTTVKVLDIADMLHVTPPSEGWGVYYDPTGGSGGGIGPDPPDIPIAPTGPDPGPELPTPDPDDTIKLHYNRIVDLQNHALSDLPIDGFAQWSIRSLIYDSVSRNVLVLQRQSYAYGFTDNNFSIDAFPIQQPTAPVRRYYLADNPASPLHSLSGGLSPAHFCISGNISTSDESLLLGSIKASPYECVLEAESIPTYYHKGSIGDIINCINNNPIFADDRIPPTATGDFNAAFSTILQPVSIKYYTKEIICHP